MGTNSTYLGTTKEKPFPLSDWEEMQLKDLPQEGIDCLLSGWKMLKENSSLSGKTHCNGTWDSVSCWPPTLAGLTILKPCDDVIRSVKDMEVTTYGEIAGNAIRICSDDGSWLWGNWTNYTECVQNLDENDEEFLVKDPGNLVIVNIVKYILFIGSILSLLMLFCSLIIFSYFKSLRCDRNILHVNLMLSLAIRFGLLIYVTEPFIFQRTNHYRNTDWICKLTMSLLVYATLSSVNWMFVQGHYLHSRLTTNIFDKGTPMKIYLLVGWVLPFILISIWAYIMEQHHPVHCWEKFSEKLHTWIIIGPMIFALSVNLLFLINIMRILLTKVQIANISSDSVQFRRAVKATALLFPLLGINNLLFVYNPGEGFEEVYMIANTLLQSTQGIFVSFFYCFMSNDVKQALRREWAKFLAQRSTRSIRRNRNSQLPEKSFVRTVWSRGTANSFLLTPQRKQSHLRQEPPAQAVPSIRLELTQNYGEGESQGSNLSIKRLKGLEVV